MSVLSTQTNKLLKSLNEQDTIFIFAVVILLLCQRKGRMMEAIEALKTIEAAS
jgi:hypothetical protein